MAALSKLVARMTVHKHLPSGMWRASCTQCGAAYEQTHQGALTYARAHYAAKHLPPQGFLPVDTWERAVWD